MGFLFYEFNMVPLPNSSQGKTLNFEFLKPMFEIDVMDDREICATCLGLFKMQEEDFKT